MDEVPNLPTASEQLSMAVLLRLEQRVTGKQRAKAGVVSAVTGQHWLHQDELTRSSLEIQMLTVAILMDTHI